MSDGSSAELQTVLDRVRQGDVQARRELLERACARLRRLAAHMLHGSFEQLGKRHEVDSVVHETWVRLLQALESAQPPTTTDFFRFAAHKIRQVLLDMVQAERRRADHEVARWSASGAEPGGGGGNQTYDPA